MFFCTGCKNVQAIEPAPAPPSPDSITVCAVAGEPYTGLDTLPLASNEKMAITQEHSPLPPSTPDSEVAAEDEENDMRMPVNRVASSFDNSNYSQKFTVHTIPSSKLSIRAYEGLPEKYVTIDTTEPLTLPITTLREVLNSIQPDPEKKRLGNSLIIMIGCLFVSILLRTRD